MKFKCLISGNTIELVHAVDIETTLAHPHYEVVVEEKPVVVKKEVVKETLVTK